MVFLRCPKAALTISLNNFSSVALTGFFLGLNLTIADVTFGAGIKAVGGTSKSFSISQWYWLIIESRP